MDSFELKRLAGSNNPKLVKFAIERWLKSDSRDPEPLRLALASDQIEIVKTALPSALLHFAEACRPQILGFFTHENHQYRKAAVEAVCVSAEGWILEATRTLLEKEKHPHVIASAVIAAGRLNFNMDLLKPFLSHHDGRVRANTVRAMSASANPRNREMVIPLLNDPSIRVQNEVLKVLGGFASQTELNDLVNKRLNSPDSLVRASTAWILADLPVSDRVGLLSEKLKDPVESVITCACKALVKIFDPAGLRNLANFYLTTEKNTLVPWMKSILAPLDPHNFLRKAETLGAPESILEETLSRLLLLGKESLFWQPFLPWIHGALRRREKHLRLAALKIIAEKAEFFRNRIEETLEKCRCSFEPEEKAMISKIRWKVGKPVGLDVLKTMMRSVNIVERKAAADVLRSEPNLIFKQILFEAAREGILEARVEEKIVPLKGVDLPKE